LLTEAQGEGFGEVYIFRRVILTHSTRPGASESGLLIFSLIARWERILALRPSTILSAFGHFAVLQGKIGDNYATSWAPGASLKEA
jgi:hypothetical protein